MVVQCASAATLKAKIAEAGGKLVVVDFFATWCGPCKAIAPFIADLEPQMENVVFLKVDVDEAEDAAVEYDISAMPTFKFIKNGVAVRRLMFFFLKDSYYVHYIPVTKPYLDRYFNLNQINHCTYFNKCETPLTIFTKMPLAKTKNDV